MIAYGLQITAKVSDHCYDIVVKDLGHRYLKPVYRSIGMTSFH